MMDDRINRWLVLGGNLGILASTRMRHACCIDALFD